jgi:hypothetical protein
MPEKTRDASSSRADDAAQREGGAGRRGRMAPNPASDCGAQVVCRSVAHRIRPATRTVGTFSGIAFFLAEDFPTATGKRGICGRLRFEGQSPGGRVWFRVHGGWMVLDLPRKPRAGPPGMLHAIHGQNRITAPWHIIRKGTP